MKTIDYIVTGPKPAKLVRYAAQELRRYAQRLFGHAPRLVAGPPRDAAGIAITLDASAPRTPATLSEQGYVLRPVQANGREMFQVAGGSPVATLWAVHDLVERWGVRYELHGDLFPDRPGTPELPAQPIVCEPDLKLRSFRTYNDFANNPCRWPAEDYRVLIDQLAKMRINAIHFVIRPCDPFVDLKFRGARKQLAATNFGWRLPIRPDHPGHELFVQSGDAARGEFANADLDGIDDYDKAHQAGKTYIRKVFRMAHARGMKCIVNVAFTDFDPVIKMRLRELTHPRHKTSRSAVVRIKYGVFREGADVETGRCMGLKNPVFFDLMAATIQAHIDCVPDADVFCLGRSEFGGPPADGERAWKALDRKYGLSKVARLEDLIAEARRTAEGDADRSERELRSNVVTLYALDHLINERGFDLSNARKGVQFMPGGLSPELHRVLPLIFPRGAPYMASMGYMPTHVASRMDTIQLDDPGAIRFAVSTSLEDDNIGLIPQLTGPALCRIIEPMRANKADGFLTRQWMHSNLLPTLHYLSHTAWQRGWTPRKAYEHFFRDLCGPKAMTHVHKAFRIIEQITEDLHKNVFCVSFPVPTWITGFWDSWPESHTPNRLEGIGRTYQRASEALVSAVAASSPAGKEYLRSLERHARHAVLYCQAMAELARAYDTKQQAQQAKQDSSYDGFDRASAGMVEHLERCAALMQQACETFAQGVRDRCDLGALATLNHYNLDAVNALKTIATAEASMFCFTEQ